MEEEKRVKIPVSSASPARLADSRAVRWYVMVLPSCHKGPAKGLQQELERRIRKGEPAFEYFAPSYVEVKNIGGKLMCGDRSLFYNYVFIRASENEIFRIKQMLPLYNFLPRVKEKDREYYPYLSDAAMENLQWVARSYSEVLPVYVPEPDKLMRGDRVRITGGQFKGAEASVVIQPGAGQKDIMVCVDNWMWVPLLHVKPGQYEVISLHDGHKHVYTRFDNDRILSGLHEAIGRHHSLRGVTEEDRRLAAGTLQQYAGLQMESDIMRSKHYALLLQAYTILGNRSECDRLIGTICALLPLMQAEQSRALLFSVLYGCTDNSIWFAEAHAIIDRWRKETAPKKSKLRLIDQLADYDRWLGHK